MNKTSLGLEGLKNCGRCGSACDMTGVCSICPEDDQVENNYDSPIPPSSTLSYHNHG